MIYCYRNLILFFCCLIFGFEHKPAKANDRVEASGTAITLILPVLSVGTSIYMQDVEGRNQFYKSFVSNLGITYGLKSVVDKDRPNHETQSFPSGHTSISFQSAAFMHRRYGGMQALPAYLAASYVGYTRIEADKHYVEDVLAGAVLGYFSSYYFTQQKTTVVVNSLIERRSLGLGFQIRW